MGKLWKNIESENLKKWKTYVEDFKTGDIQYTDEELPLGFGIKSLVDPLDQPVEHTIVQRLSQGSDGVGDLGKETEGMLEQC